MLRHRGRNGAPTHLRFFLKPVRCEAKRCTIKHPPRNRAVKGVDDGRDIGLGKVKDAPLRIERKRRLNLRPGCMQALVQLGSVGRIIKVEAEALKKHSYRSRSRPGTEITVRPGAKPLVAIGLGVRTNERRQFRFRGYPMLHLHGNGYGTVSPHEPGQHSVKIGSPIVDRLSPAPKGTGELGLRELVNRRVAQPSQTQRFDRVRAPRPASKLTKQEDSATLDASANTCSSRACQTPLIHSEVSTRSASRLTNSAHAIPSAVPEVRSTNLRRFSASILSKTGSRFAMRAASNPSISVFVLASS